jgi:hypothetical protein
LSLSLYIPPCFRFLLFLPFYLSTFLSSAVFVLDFFLSPSLSFLISFFLSSPCN